jgi:hypothetical protein
MISSEFAIATSQTNDTERTSYIKRIQLETNFYNVFRNTIRILLNDYENIKKRETIEQELNKPYVLYSTKLRNVITYLRELVKETIVFSNDYNYELINTISTCIVLPEDKCNEKQPVCAFVKGQKCKMIIPKRNLLTSENDNEVLYFGKMADELIRYSRIKSFIFQPQTYLSFGSLGYNLRENEFIIIQSLLTKEYFDDLTPEVVNNYAKYNTFDNAEPKQADVQVYENRVVINEGTQGDIEKKGESSQFLPTETNISSKIWKDSFPSTFRELYYDDEHSGFYLIIDIIEKKTGNRLKLNEVKAELLVEYEKYLPKYSNQIIDILVLEGKKTNGTRVKQETMTFQHFIYLDDYFITNLDIWIMMLRYQIPSILLSTKPLLLSNKKNNAFVFHGTRDSEFLFIFSPALRAEHIPKYSIITSKPDLRTMFGLDTIKNKTSLDELLYSVENAVSMKTFLSKFSKQGSTASKKVPRKLTKLVIEEEAEEQKPEEQKPEEQEDLEAAAKKQKTFVVVKKPKQRKQKLQFVIEEE